MSGADVAERWRSRIIGYDDVAPDQLLANPANWRVHPRHQQLALSGVLGDIGWIAPVIVNQRTGHTIDGHLRVSLAISRQEPTVPVVYVDLDPAEEAEALATFDPIASLAVADREKLADLLRQVQTGNAAVMEMLSGLAEQAKAIELPDPAVPAEPMSKADHFVEIYCSREALGKMQSDLDEWSGWDGVTVNIS